MQESKLPSFQSIDEVVEFFETHDMGEYWDELPAADFEVQIKKRKRLIAIDEELMNRLDKMAQSKRTWKQRGSRLKAPRCFQAD